MAIKTLILVFLTLTVSSCAETRSLWNNHKYVETITHILVSEDGNNIVVVGKKYHYVFKDQKTLSELLKWSHKELLEFTFDEHFSLSPSNIISGRYVVSCKCKKSTPEQLGWLKDKGFKKKIDHGTLLYREDKISGKLYSPNDIDLSIYEKTSKNYKVTVESRHPFDSLAKILFTPVTIAIDTGNAIIYGSALVVASPFILFDSLSNKK